MRMAVERVITCFKARLAFQQRNQSGAGGGDVFIRCHRLGHGLESASEPLRNDFIFSDFTQGMNGDANSKKDSSALLQGNECLMLDPQPDFRKVEGRRQAGNIPGGILIARGRGA